MALPEFADSIWAEAPAFTLKLRSVSVVIWLPGGSGEAGFLPEHPAAGSE